MTAAIFFHPEAYSTDRPQLMGRHAAGESFLKGYLRHARADRFFAMTDAPEHAVPFQAAVAAASRGESVTVLGRLETPRLAEAGTLFYPGPDLAMLAARRSLFATSAWSLCGITHTTSSARAMDAITAMLAADVEPWDALICTSHAVRAQVEHLLAAEQERLRRRLGATAFALPQMPVIPLGIDTARLDFTAAERDAARAALAVGADTLIVLFAGRLSFHAKAHPLAMYRALEMAAQVQKREIVLVECGWFANAAIERAFAEAAAQACPGIRVVRLDGREAEARRTAWAAADIFCSLSDNIQETFGLTPVEAMAAGLPVVVSDWDGYRDTVRDGVDGFRIPTLMPPAGCGRDMAMRHALGIDSYDAYCGYTAAMVAVDVEAAAKAFWRLFTSDDLRRRMGEAGRARARAAYDWGVVIPRYEALWEELARLRQGAPRVSGWPARPDPFGAFSAYPTRTLAPETRLVLAAESPAVARGHLDADIGLAMVRYAAPLLPRRAELEHILGKASAEPTPASDLVSGIESARRPLVFRMLAWMVKLDLLRVAP